jgi:hypothetical protein
MVWQISPALSRRVYPIGQFRLFRTSRGSADRRPCGLRLFCAGPRERWPEKRRGPQKRWSAIPARAPNGQWAVLTRTKKRRRGVAAATAHPCATTSPWWRASPRSMVAQSLEGRCQEERCERCQVPFSQVPFSLPLTPLAPAGDDAGGEPPSPPRGRGWNSCGGCAAIPRRQLRPVADGTGLRGRTPKSGSAESGSFELCGSLFDKHPPFVYA